jgi:hypothetical protein
MASVYETFFISFSSMGQEGGSNDTLSDNFLTSSTIPPPHVQILNPGER